jgi:hypothetical protein
MSLSVIAVVILALSSACQGAVRAPETAVLVTDNSTTAVRVNGTDVTDTGKRFKVPGHPGSARGSPK